jgi:hypothetical protein
MTIPINKPLLARIQSIQNSAPQKTPLTAELVKAQSRIKQLEAENKALRIRPLAVTPAKSLAAQILALPQAARNKLPAAQIKAAHQACTDKELRLKFYQQNKTILLS